MCALPVVSLFAGAGGLDLGVERCGEPPLVSNGIHGPYRVALATDYEQAALDTLKLNCPGVETICRDIRLIPSSEIMGPSSSGSILTALRPRFRHSPVLG